MDSRDIPQLIIETGARLYRNKLIAATDGNISVRMPDKTILVTSTGTCKGELTPELLVRINESGEVLEGKFRPSSEVKMHLAAYRLRPDIHAVVHAHPPTATAFACSTVDINKALVAELVQSLGSIGKAPFGTPSTTEVPEALEPLLPCHDCILLSNHGALTMAKDLRTAYFRMETLEHFARIALNTLMIGGEQPLTRDQLAGVISIMKQKQMSNVAVEAGKLPLTLEDIRGEGK